MLTSTILLKVQERLNKLASNDYDNIQNWQIVEAFNKGQEIGAVETFMVSTLLRKVMSNLPVE